MGAEPCLPPGPGPPYTSRTPSQVRTAAAYARGHPQGTHFSSGSHHCSSLLPPLWPCLRLHQRFHHQGQPKVRESHPLPTPALPRERRERETPFTDQTLSLVSEDGLGRVPLMSALLTLQVLFAAASWA